MIARFSVSVFLAACVMWPSIVSAQSGSEPEGVVAIGDGMPAPIVPPYTSRWQTLSRVPKAETESALEPILRGQSPGGPASYAGAYAPQSGVDSYGDGSGFQAPGYQAQPLPWERGYVTPFQKFITEVLPNNYFRVEYLSWNIDDIGAQAVGARTNIVPDPREPIQSAEFFRDQSMAANPGNSQSLLIPNTESINFERVSGLRGTYGIPLTFGRLEFSAFALEESGADILDPSFGPIRGERIVTAPFELQNGQFVLAQPFTVPVNPITGQPGFDATTGGTVQVRAIPVGAGVGLPNNIPAGSQLPPSATPLPPGNPPLINFRPQILGSNTSPIQTPIGQRFNLPTGTFYGQFPVSGNTGVTQQVTFDSTVPNLVSLLNAGVINGVPPLPPPGPNPPTNVGIFFIRSGTSQNPVAGNFSPIVAITNINDPSRNPIPQFPDRFPGADAIIIVRDPANDTGVAGGNVGINTDPQLFGQQRLVPIVPGTPNFIFAGSTLLPDVLSPGGAVLTAGAVLRTNATGTPVMPLLQNGQVGSTFLIYDQGYSANYRNNVWGTEAKMILDMGPDHNGMKLKPLVGFRYMRFNEEFRQVGLSTVGSAAVLSLDPTNVFLYNPEPVRASTIDSDAENNLYGLQVGTSAEYNHKYFSLGVEPRISMGVNQYSTSVTTSQLRTITDPTIRTEDNGLTFAPVFDVNMYGQVHITPYFSLHAGYNFTYLFKVTRPAENIVYNDNGPNAAPGVIVDAESQDMHIQGLTFGGEFRFRDLKFR